MERFNFRVWDILNKRMLRWGDIFDLPAWEIFPGTPEQRPYDVMQDTGENDTKGERIYRGDIVTCLGDKCEIKFLNGTFGLRGKECFLPLHVAIDNDLEIEVIGNIYENPDLLKGEE